MEMMPTMGGYNRENVLDASFNSDNVELLNLMLAHAATNWNFLFETVCRRSIQLAYR